MTDEVRLPLDPPGTRRGLEESSDGAALRDVARSHPLSLEAWARLGDDAYSSGDDVAAYAYYRVGYHRGLDQLRSAGWRPDRHVLWAIESNRGFLRSLHGLMRAAAAIGEGVEARRCREFQLQLDPGDPLSVGGVAPKVLSRRLPD
jgi:hypothetical protein